ncbi:MAG TPA: PH domain-containing protein [Gaiellaceae bacterium]|nr:PH domain-containing protein [Gaiellaceae bacterium]
MRARRSDERVFLEERRHVVVLAGAFARAVPLAVGGAALLAVGWPASLGAPVALAAAALLVLRAVWRWDRTRLVVTEERLAVVQGTLRRRAASVPLARVGAIELDQSLLGRLLGYGTICAGELEVSHVPRPREVTALVERLAA